MVTRRQVLAALAASAAAKVQAQEGTAALPRDEGKLGSADLRRFDPAALMPGVEPVRWTTLPSGLRATAVQRSAKSRSDFVLHLRVTPQEDPPAIAGLSEVAAELLPLSRCGGSGLTLQEQVESKAATVNAVVSYASDTTELRLRSIGSDDLEIVSMLLRVLNDPTLAPEHLDRWRKAKGIELAQKRRNPRYLAEKALRRALYPQAGDARSVVDPTAESLSRLSVEEIGAFRRRYYRPSGAVLGACAAMASSAIYDGIGRMASFWEPGLSTVKAESARRDASVGASVTVVDLLGSSNVHLSIGARAFDRFDADYPAAVVLSRILGYGQSSRLYQKLRRERGYAYDVFSGFSAARYLSHFTTTTAVDYVHAADAVSLILEEFRSLREQLVSPEELKAAQLRIMGTFLGVWDDPVQRLSLATDVLNYDLESNYWMSYLRAIAATTAEDVRSVSRRHLPVDAPQIVAVGEAKRLDEALGRFGPTTVVSAE